MSIFISLGDFMSEPRVVPVNDLPVNKDGRPTPQLLAKLLGTESWLSRPHITTYSGARRGNNPYYMKEAQRFSGMLDAANIVLNNGGGSDGLMGAVGHHCRAMQCFQASIFYKSFGVGNAEGANQHAVNCILPDFFLRKVALNLFSLVSLCLWGGIGSIEEIIEDLAFCGDRNRKAYILNNNGFYDSFYNQLDFFKRSGLMPVRYDKHLRFVSSVDEFMSRAEKEILSPLQKPEGIPHQVDPKPLISTRQYLDNHLNAFLSELKHFIAPLNKEHPEQVPRIGIFASSNIGPDESNFSLQDASLRHDMCAETKRLGTDLGKAKALVLISGDNEGLRKIVAQNALKNGGRVIWVRKERIDLPLTIRHKNNQELVISVPRHYEKDMVMSLLCESYVALAGGIHTADQVIGFMTRNQTGFGVFSEILPEYYAPSAPRPKIFLYNPLMPGGQKSLWDGFDAQIAHGIKEGFIGEKDRGLLRGQPTTEGLAAKAIADSRNHPNFLFKVPRDRSQIVPVTPQAEALTDLLRHPHYACALA